MVDEGAAYGFTRDEVNARILRPQDAPSTDEDGLHDLMGGISMDDLLGEDGA